MTKKPEKNVEDDFELIPPPESFDTKGEAVRKEDSPKETIKRVTEEVAEKVDELVTRARNRAARPSSPDALYDKVVEVEGWKVRHEGRVVNDRFIVLQDTERATLPDNPYLQLHSEFSGETQIISWRAFGQLPYSIVGDTHD